MAGQPVSRVAGGGDRSGANADVSGLLRAWREGDATARDRLMQAVYHELRRTAAAHLRGEPARITLTIATVEREWQAAGAWLYSRLTAGAKG